MKTEAASNQKNMLSLPFDIPKPEKSDTSEFEFMNFDKLERLTGMQVLAFTFTQYNATLTKF